MMCNISEYFIFQQESAPADETVDLLTETPDFTLPNSQRLVQNDRLHECFTFCKNLSGINNFTLTYL